MRMELDVIAMACQLFGTAPNAQARSPRAAPRASSARCRWRRDHARTVQGIAEPQLLTATTAHPAFAKAAKYLDVEHILVPRRRRRPGRPSAAMTEAAMGPRTGLVVGSAPCYPFGVVDPIEGLAGDAAERGILFHTDACLGGWLLPWYERLGIDLPSWDFRVPGVTSLSADIHKYGYTYKGASIVARTVAAEELLEHQFFWYDSTGPAGPSTASRYHGRHPPGRPDRRGAWAAINRIGVDGYLRDGSHGSSATPSPGSSPASEAHRRPAGHR